MCLDVAVSMWLVSVSSVAAPDLVDLVTPRTVTRLTRTIVIVRLSGEGEAGAGPTQDSGLW